MSKKIPLTQGYFATVDDEDFERLNQYTWHYIQAPNRNTGYAERSFRSKGKRVNVKMHWDVYGERRMLDHINGNGLDNRKENLRPCNNVQNKQNVFKRKGKTHSKYKGVSRRKNGKWRAIITVNKKQIELGLFEHEYDAAKAYDKAALKYFKQFARINTYE